MVLEKPKIQFDSSNRLHRKWYNGYIITGSWGHCPVVLLGTENYHGVAMTAFNKYKNDIRKRLSNEGY